ncbi:transcriptional regulator [Nesterenkonia xinjiangensis]|uniref:GAF domain-containing protein n=1 Tax=Nesterenkonia xinjiangensis TaxID=225327 RepID=A0A7Z0KDF4_9MICC|nr:transcriptional regulator [Nesterenkonia xinjiangensis]NYJ79567.1 hypothetical protein [Nesterenkonia xinjiangensis]
MMREAVPDEPQTWEALPPMLRESWRRSSGYLKDPGHASPPIDLSESDLPGARREHPLSAAMPVFDRLLIQPARDAGLIVAVGDAQGRLLWVDGDRPTLRRAESQGFQAGANWSERAIGTSAPGTALASGRAVKVDQEQHFAVAAHRFSCSAAPVHCPHTGGLLGMVDITGGREAVATHSLPLVVAAIAAAQGELRSTAAGQGLPRLITLGQESPSLARGPASWRLSPRHADLLVLLGWETGGPRGRAEAGMNAAQLAEDLFGEPGHEVSLRAEVNRLRRVLTQVPAPEPGLTLLSRPYRLSQPLPLDAVDVYEALRRGDRATALDLYAGDLLPRSQSPGITRIRWELSAMLREAVLQDGSPLEICRYLQLPEARGDEAALREALRLLPPDSPERALLVARSTT